MIKVIKKDGTKEEFNVQKVVVAVNKSAYRALVTFTEEELDFICNFVTEKVEQMRKKEVTISDMHNVVEGALEQTNPLVAKSYRDYRNYKQDFVQMLDEVYKKSQSIMYIGDKENSNTDSALVSTKRSLIFNELNETLKKMGGEVVGINTDTLDNNEDGIKEAKELKKEIKKIEKQLKQLNYIDEELSPKVEINIDFAKRHLVDTIYKQAILEGVATTFADIESK